MTVLEKYEILRRKYSELFLYEDWRNMEMRDGKLSIEEFNNLPPFDLISMYDEWKKQGSWEYGADPLSG